MCPPVVEQGLAALWSSFSLSDTVLNIVSRFNCHLPGLPPPCRLTIWFYSFLWQPSTHQENSRSPVSPGDSVYRVQLGKRWKFRRGFVMGTRRELTSVTQGIFFKLPVFRLLFTLFYSDAIRWMLPH